MLKENTPRIETQSLILRQFTPNDTHDLLEILSDEQANTFLPWHAIKTLQGANEFLQDKFLKQYALPAAYRYAVCIKQTNAPIGYVWLSNSESNHFIENGL